MDDAEKTFSKRARVKSRRCALQALYQMQFHDISCADVIQEFRNKPELRKADEEYFQSLLNGVVNHNERLLQLLEPTLDREIKDLDYVELAILKIGTYELLEQPEIPWRVVMNESIELAKMFGAEESHKYINSILDKIARQVRQVEIDQLA